MFSFVFFLVVSNNLLLLLRTHKSLPAAVKTAKVVTESVKEIRARAKKMKLQYLKDLFDYIF